MNYIVSFDLLRFVAVFLVLLWHWIPETDIINYPINGRLGVVLFFVLSGFLISNGLASDTKTKTTFKTILSFYLKRFLRIFPIYYLLLLFLFVVNYNSFREHQLWYWLYASNVYEELGNKHVAYLVHTWTLAIEEQFYLVWPLLFILVGQTKRNLLIYIVAILSILFYIYSSFSSYNLLKYVSSFKFFFCFSFGALLAFNPKILQFFNTKTVGVFVIIIIGGMLRMFHMGNIPWGLNIFFLDLSYAILAMVLISICIKYNSVVKNNATILAPFIFLGRISYGIYLYHYLMYPLYHFLHTQSLKYNLRYPIVNIILFPEFQNAYLRFFVFFALVVVLSIISYRIIEQPLLKLKKRL